VFGPYSLIFTWTGGTPPVPPPTYINTPNASIYTGGGGTYSLAAGSSVTIPVACQILGALGSAPSLTLSMTTTILGCTATNTDPIVGADRETATLYRARCRQAEARISLGGPAAAYEYLSTKNLDGTPLLNGSGNVVAITRTQVSQDSATGNVVAYYATTSGAATSEDVTAANTNIEVTSFAVPDAITFAGYAATEQHVSIGGSVSVRGGAGVTTAAVQAAIVAKILAESSEFPIGGRDSDLSNGTLYVNDVIGWIFTAYPGIFHVSLAVPAADVSISSGNVMIPDTIDSSWTVTIV
jgi:hypothetical protein